MLLYPFSPLGIYCHSEGQKSAIYAQRASALRGGNESHCPKGATTKGYLYKSSIYCRKAGPKGASLFLSLPKGDALWHILQYIANRPMLLARPLGIYCPEAFSFLFLPKGEREGRLASQERRATKGPLWGPLLCLKAKGGGNKRQYIAHRIIYSKKYFRDDRIRTCDPMLPKHMRYQAALHPVIKQLLII